MLCNAGVLDTLGLWLWPLPGARHHRAVLSCGSGPTGPGQLIGPLGARPLPQVLDTRCPWDHLHFLISKEEEDEEATSSLQGHLGPPGLSLPAPLVQGVADDMGLGGVEARVEVDGDVRPGMQAAAALEVHLEPGGRGGSPRVLPVRDPRIPSSMPPGLSSSMPEEQPPYLRAPRGTSPCSMTILPARKPPKIVVT